MFTWAALWILGWFVASIIVVVITYAIFADSDNDDDSCPPTGRREEG